MKRILTAFVFFPLFYLVNSLCPPEAFSAFACLCAVVASWELSRLAKAKGLVSHWPLNAAAALVVSASFAAFHLDPPQNMIPLAALVLVTLVLTLAYLFTGREENNYLESLATALLSCSFLGLLIGYQVALRMVDSTADGAVRGDFLIYYLFLVTWIGDAGALYTGRSLGRHKLSPRISPNKTVEGAAGSLVASVLASLGIRAWFIPEFGLFDAVALGILLNVLGQLGDLAESGLKRSAGVKDSATFIPGHGGVLDRGDSLLFAGPVLYYYYILLIVG